MKKKKEFMYEYPFDMDTLLTKLNKKDGCYHQYLNGQYLIDIKDEKTFFLGVERVGHNGYFYVGHIQELDNKVFIYGNIVYAPDENGNEERMSKKERFFFILACIFGFPLWIIYFVLFTFFIIGSYLFNLIFNKKKVVEKTKEEKLDDFMIQYLECKKLNEMESKINHARLLIKDIIDDCNDRLSTNVDLKNKFIIEIILKEFVEFDQELVKDHQVHFVSKIKPLNSTYVIIDSADLTQDKDLFDKVFAFKDYMLKKSKIMIIYNL